MSAATLQSRRRKPKDCHTFFSFFPLTNPELAERIRPNLIQTQPNLRILSTCRGVALAEVGSTHPLIHSFTHLLSKNLLDIKQKIWYNTH